MATMENPVNPPCRRQRHCSLDATCDVDLFKPSQKAIVELGVAIDFALQNIVLDRPSLKIQHLLKRLILAFCSFS